jgi:hypothetical protein
VCTPSLPSHLFHARESEQPFKRDGAACAGELAITTLAKQREKAFTTESQSAEKTRERPRTLALFFSAVLHLDDAVEHLSTREVRGLQQKSAGKRKQRPGTRWPGLLSLSMTK